MFGRFVSASRPFGARALGNAARGPSSITDINAHLNVVKSICSKPTVNHSEWVQQCESIRTLAFVGVTGILALDLIIDAPQSSYWRLF